MARIHKYFHYLQQRETGIGEKANNAAVQHLMTGKGKGVVAGGKGKHKYTQAQRAKIATYAAKNGNAAAERHFSKVFPGLGEYC